MFSKSHAKQLLDALAKAKGEKLTFEENDDCVLVSESNHLMHIHFNEVRGEFEMYGVVCQIPDDEVQSAAFVTYCMSANFMWLDSMGATFALVGENDIIVQRTFSDANALDHVFLDAVFSFEEEFDFWVQNLAAQVDAHKNTNVSLIQNPQVHDSNSILA